MARRTKFVSGIENGGANLKIHYRELGKDFGFFFPHLITFAQSFLHKM